VGDRREIGPPAEGYPGPSTLRVARDGSLIGFTCQSGEVVACDAATGARRMATTVIGEVADIAFSPDATLVAAASKNFYNAQGGNPGVTVWRVADSSMVCGLLPHEDGARSVAFDPTGRKIASAGADRRVQIWDAATGRPLGPAIDLGSPGERVAFDSTGRMLLTAAESTGVRLWDAASGEARSPMLDTAAGARHAVLSEDGDRLLVLDAESVARLWHMRRPAPTSSQAPATSSRAERGHCFAATDIHSDATTACLSPDGAHALVCGEGSSHLIRLARSVPSVHLTHSGSIADATFSPDGRRFACGGYDGAIRVWDAPSGRLRLALRSEGEIKQVLFSPDGRLILAATGRRVSAWRVADGRVAATVAPASRRQQVAAMAVSPDGRTLAVADEAGRVELHDTAGGVRRGRFAGPRGVTSMEFSPDSIRLLVAGEDGAVVIVNARTCRRDGPDLRQPVAVRHACWSPDGRAIAASTGEPNASGPRSAHLWHSRTGHPLVPPMVHRGAVRHVGFSPDGKLVVTSGADRTVRVWSALTGEPIAQPLQMPGQVYFAQVGRGNRLVLAASNEGTVRLFRLLKATGTPKDLADLAQAISGSRIDAVGGVVKLPVTELRRLAARLPKLRPVLRP